MWHIHPTPPHQLGEPATKIARFAGHLRDALMVCAEPELLELAAATLGHLVRTGGALAADVVDSEVRKALDWLQPIPGMPLMEMMKGQYVS